VYLPEGVLAADLRQLQESYPSIEIGSYPFHEDGRYGSRLVLSGTDAPMLSSVAEKLEALIARLQGEYMWEEG
jgi:hypothetical protein